METVYYTLTAREILVEGAAVQRASGGSARQLVCVRKREQTGTAPAGKVIDLTAWKADREGEAPSEELWYDSADECLARTQKPASPRRGRRCALGLDLWASVGVLSVAAVLLVRVLCAF